MYSRGEMNGMYVKGSRTRLIAVAAAVAVTGIGLVPGEVAASAASLTTVSLAVPDVLVQWPTEYYMGKSNVCAPYGLKVNVTTSTPTASAAGLASGSLDFIIGGEQVIVPTVQGISDNVLLGDAGTFPGNGLYAVKTIPSLAALKAQIKKGTIPTVGATTPGGFAGLVPTLMLEHDGFKENSQFKVAYLGSSTASVAAQIAGRVQLSDQSPPVTPQMTTAGIHEIQTLESTGLGYLFENFLSAKRSYVEAHPTVVKSFIQCFGAAVKGVRTNHLQAAKAMATFVPSGLAYSESAIPLQADAATLMPVKVPVLLKLLNLYLKNPPASTATKDAAKVIDNAPINSAGVDIPAIS
jgi:ABC-type nitrate/sulfonate/bicarbonate transport system substrate-binding protein